jgi:hypothetical protein
MRKFKIYCIKILMMYKIMIFLAVNQYGLIVEYKRFG